MERADFYHENAVQPALSTSGDPAITLVPVEPGAIVTLSTVSLGTLPDGFAID